MGHIWLLTTLLLGLQHPTVSVNSQQRIFVGEGANNYCAFPDVCRMKNGKLICVFYSGYGHISHPSEAMPLGGKICYSTSDDEGAHWSNPQTAIDTPLDDRDPSITSLPNGDLILNFFTYEKNAACDTCVARSKDFGKTWSKPEIVAPGMATSSSIRRLKSGRLLLPVYAVDGNPSNHRTYTAVLLSDDNAKNWSHPYRIATKPGMVLDETDFVERKDGSILAVMREVMASSISTDGGKTWMEPQPMGFAGHCPNLLMTSQKVLLLAHRLPMTSLHFSLDEGATWQGPVEIDHFIGAYPSMVQLKNGDVLCVYYEEGAKSAIRSAIIHINGPKQ